MSGDYLWDRSGPRDPDVERLERALGSLALSDPPPALRALPALSEATLGTGLDRVSETRPHDTGLAFETRLAYAIKTRPRSVVAAGILLAASVAGLCWFARPVPEPGFVVTRLTGTPRIASRPVDDRAELSAGGSLDTNAGARASIDIGGAGRVDVDPDSRVSLLSSRTGEYRLRLTRGTLHALIWAPPGQFAVETPSSTAVDLGCSYTLTIDDEGVGTVKVETGWVGFEWQGRESFIPAGAMCVTRPGRGPGTPYYEDASPALRAAVEMIDIGGGSRAERRGAVDQIVAAAHERDTVTLWHLLARVDASDRDRVFDALARFVPAPEGVTKDGIRAGRRDMLDAWWDRLGLGTAAWWRTWRQDWRENPARR